MHVPANCAWHPKVLYSGTYLLFAMASVVMLERCMLQRVKKVSCSRLTVMLLNGWRHSSLSDKNGLIYLDMWRFVVVHLHSTLFVCHNMLIQSNLKFRLCLIIFCVFRWRLVNDDLISESRSQHILHIAAGHSSSIYRKQSTHNTRRIWPFCCWIALSHCYLCFNLHCSGQLRAVKRLAVLWLVPVFL